MRGVNYIRDILCYRGVNYIRARNHFRVNNNIRLTDMQIFIVYAHIHDLIVPAQIIVRFHPSLTGEETYLVICLFMGELHLQIRLNPAINKTVIHLHSSRPHISTED